MPNPAKLSPVGEIVRANDPDRYFTALFAPPARREALFILYAFNHELARAREAAREPMAALIRLQWWREVVEGARFRHEVAGPFGEALDAGWLDPDDLMAMIDAREAETGSIDTMADFEAYVMGTAGGVMVAAGRALGMVDAESLRLWGAAYGITGVLRSVSALARQERCVLPRDQLAAFGLSAGAVIAAPTGTALEPVRARLLNLAAAWLATRPALPRHAVAAGLPVVYARRDWVRGAPMIARPMLDRLSVSWAALSGRL